MSMRGRLVQMPVPPVRPLLRRTIKRFLRLLPSILLLLFVISLIFVTLMQIAVIHTHRRLQRSPQNTPTNTGVQIVSNQSTNKLTEPQPQPLHHSVSTASAIVINGLSATNRVLQSSDRNSNPNTVPNQKLKKSEVLRIEALLDKNLPSIETNSQILQNYVNSGRIRQIIDQLTFNRIMNISFIMSVISQLSKQTNRSTDTFEDLSLNMFSVKTIRTNSETNNESKSFLTANNISYGITTRDQLLNEHHFDHSNESDLLQEDNQRLNWTSVVSTPYQSKPICDAIPPKLMGRVRIEPQIRIDDQMSQIFRMNGDLRAGGSWQPIHCYARHRVAVIIPFRDRFHHLSTLLYHLHPILKRQMLSYKIYVIEQYGSDTFNKGVLMNAGVREALKENDFHCFVFHDVDLIPEDDRNLYSCPFAPRHMSVAVDKFNYTLPYPDLVGGVLSITKSNFILVNGYSNLYWGWGGEDDDMAHRLKFHNLHIIRPPESIGRYTMIKHNHRPESPNNVRSALLRMAKRRAFRDGLGSVRYKVVFKHQERCYTHIMVMIGHIHKWHFPSPNKLVLHFR